MTNNNSAQGIIFSSETFERERKLYEDQINSLKEHNKTLTEMISKLLKQESLIKP